jgi:hypothetical protein
VTERPPPSAWLIVAVVLGLGLLVNALGAVVGIRILEMLGLWPLTETPPPALVLAALEHPAEP